MSSNILFLPVTDQQWHSVRHQHMYHNFGSDLAQKVEQRWGENYLCECDVSCLGQFVQL
jgi:hypothetical protein